MPERKLGTEKIGTDVHGHSFIVKTGTGVFNQKAAGRCARQGGVNAYNSPARLFNGNQAARTAA
jgi:hypothetical protein